MVKHWTLTTLRDKLIMIGGKMVRHAQSRADMTGLNDGQCDGQARDRAVNLDEPDPEGATTETPPLFA